MYHYYFTQGQPEISVIFIILFIMLLIWTYFWKAAALWHAVRNKDKVWFAVFLLVNTLGILDMIYLFGIEKVKTDTLFK